MNDELFHYAFTMQKAMLLRWTLGMPAELWFHHAPAIQGFVAAHKLEPVSPEQLPWQGSMAKPLAGQGSETLELRMPPHFPGGMRVPHLHLGDKVYKLTSEQWKDFSGKVMKGFAAKLAEAGTVSLPRLLELSSAIDSMA